MSRVTYEHILHPFDGFDAAAGMTTYEGQSALTPIGFYPGGKPLHPQAGNEGFVTTLANALPVPFGATVYITLPLIWGGAPGSEDPRVDYIWQIGWRDRFPEEKPSGQEYHMSKRIGVDSKYFIPAMWSTRTFNQAEPAPAGLSIGTLADRVIDNTHCRDYAISAGTTALPLVPNGGALENAWLQQGVFDPKPLPTGIGSATIARTPSFMRLEEKALGDELLIQVYRPVTAAANWAFGGYDAYFSRLFGTRTAGCRAGIRVFWETEQ